MYVSLCKPLKTDKKFSGDGSSWCLPCLRETTLGLGDGSAGKLLATQSPGHGFDPYAHMLKPGMLVPAYFLSTGEAETGASLGLLAHVDELVSSKPMRGPRSNSRLESS